MKPVNKKILIISISLVLVLIVSLFVLLMNNVDDTAAAPEDTIEIKINKVTTVTIYAFGSGVEFISSNSNYDLYEAEVGTTVRLQAVNETRIFTDWVITETANEEAFIPSGVDLTNNIINVPITAETKDLTVTVNRRDALAEDYGKYMLDRFVIVDEYDLIALQNIIAGSNDDAYFEKYYENPTTYNTVAKKDSLRKDLQHGYFLIANNFTVFNEEFTGIGTSDMPFQGIVCGKNTNVSKLFITITVDEQTSDSHYGLFKFLGNEAVVRNLVVSTSIGVSPIVGNANTTIYAGGLAAVMNKSTLVDVEVSSSISIESNLATKVYAGGLAGSMTAGSGIDSISDVVFQGTDAKWSIVSHKQNSELHSGLIAGTATDTYIKEVDIITTDLNVELKNDAIENTYTNSKLYLGNVFGSYVANTSDVIIDDIMIMGNAGEFLKAMTTNGDAAVGGLIGYVDASKTGTLNVEKVYFRVLGTESEYTASTISPTSVGNTYAGGIIGVVNGSNVYALNGFKNRLETITLSDNSTKLEANYLFTGDYNISAVQNGKSTATSNGKSIVGGIIGKGMFNLNGTNVEETNLALASPDASLVVEAIQTKTTSTNGTLNDKEHACAGLIYGSIGDTKVSMANINVYSNNTIIQTIREIGSRALGDLHTGGFISFARNGSSFENINMYLNDSSVLTESLSYEAKNTNEDTNSAYCGGFAGEMLENSSLVNFEFAGYDVSLFDVIGTTSKIESIQNTVPGGGNYRGENYIGGVVGRIQYVTLENCIFYGSSSDQDHIKMNGHESPDSAFCGGIVGLIRTAKNDVPSSVIGCEVIDTEVIGNATCIIRYDNPDIYIGGIIGATYIHDTNSSVTVSGCRLTRSNVYALGNEIITAFAGGIVGGSTWQSSIAINDCYVMESSITSNVTTKLQNTNTLESTAGGIMGGMKGNPNNKNVSIANCAIIDTEVNAEVNSTFTNISAYAAGVLGYMENASSSNISKVTITNCYSNAYVTATHENSSGASNAYGITFNGTISTTNKDVNATVERTIYLPFEYNGYDFEVVSAESGTYRIYNKSNGQYVRINRNSITTGTKNNATTFTYQPTSGRLAYNNRFINFNNTTMSYANNGFDFRTVPGIELTKTELYTGATSVKANNSYYLKKNVNDAANSLGTALGTGPFNIPNNSTAYPYSGYEYLYGFDGVGQKFYIEIIDGEDKIYADNQKDVVNSITSNSSEPCTALAHIWINAKANGGVDGNNLIVPSHDDKEKAAQNGWFIIDYVLLYSGSITNISSDISNLKTSYTKGNDVYEHHKVDETHYVENKNNTSDKIYDNYAEDIYVETVDDVDYSIPEFTFKVYDDMLTFNADFEITHFGANYQLRFLDGMGNVIDQSYFNANYGSIELKLIQKHSTVVDEYKDKYHLEFKPNELIENDVTFYIRFIGGNNAVSAKTLFRVNLIANKLTLVGVTYADYTPPLNYYDQSGTIGTIANPYQLYVDSITKFIPIFTKSNDIIPGRKYIIEDYIEKCTYSIDSSSDAHFDVHSNGELKADATEYQDGILTVTHKKSGDTQVVYFSSSRDISVSYSATGADISGITHASDSTNFYFEQEIRSNYSGIPNLFTIKIGNQVYDLTENPNAYPGIEIYEKDNNGNINPTVLTDYYADAKDYVVIVDNSLLTGDSITVAIEYPVVCMITFKLQCDSFNDLSEEQTQKVFKIIGGTTFKEYFTADVIEELNEWAKAVAPFGYVFLGFYLVNDANSIPSYGIGFDQLCNSEYKINSSNSFYARWSYLIELVEAPGTYIKTGFNNDFMFDYFEDDFTRKIQIPINNNQGYVFRIDKDSHYIGDVGAEAYIVRVVNGNKVMTEVPIENYQDNANVYYIRPEYITGYLVIMTSVGNSEVIVGEHTSSITENITPEDGVLTFKYIVNHYYNENGAKSYIYNLNLSNGLTYQNLNKEFVLDFYKQSTHEDLKLPDFTEIRVYYNCYVDGSTTPSNTLVGTYITYNDDRVYLTEFKTLDLETPVFGNDITFKEFLERDVADKSNYTVTEVYYFSIIPLNGYSEKVKNEMANFVVECGYCNGKAEPHKSIEYLQGERTDLDLANPDDLADVVQSINIYENSKQEQIYHVIPSRNTEIKQENGSYVFIDNDTYSVYDIILTDTQKFPDFNYISLYDNDKQSILATSKMSFNIKEVILKLGYRLGKLKIYGQTKEGIWEEVCIVDVTSAVYSDYVIDFKGTDPENPYPYYAFKIDNISTNEIRVMEIGVVSGTNGVLYDGPITSFVEKSVDSNTSTYTLTKNIVGDSRHDGKVFMLAIQLSDKTTGEIVDNIDGSIYLEIKNIGLGISHKVYLDEYLGKNVGYINLSNILKVLNVKEITFDIIIPDEYNIYAVQLLEVVNEYKPSQGEVRDKLINSNMSS